ncbi:MAG: sulfate ABC transporter substrate-binding protein [Betaproteobacteria bacterium]|nr:sulfate ABC transporter substrate-binding protein [Betaproteobacteria bacterium]NBY13848.1 sulfate ABC transporter substrate-binding protein [Betaproteobacteria bacterium]NDF03669.1 sulfate ABC transporter substrate-binding protein [Betaproteobacteria bacterium]
MNAPLSRRQFFRVCSAGVMASSAVGLGLAPGQAVAEVRPYKLARTTETRGTCPYCSVSCGVVMYSREEQGKRKIIHIEGDPDNPVNKGTLCPKGAGLLDMVHSPNRLLQPEIREAGSSEWKTISWDDALSKVARLMKKDRDANFIEKNAEGVTVNRWNSTAFIVSSTVSNEAGYLGVKMARGLGMVALDTQARI